MGFAQVLRYSGCDQHLVQLLVKPIRRVRALLIPGTVAVGCIVNISVRRQRLGRRSCSARRSAVNCSIRALPK
jgi:hypothetical protein